MTRVQEFEPGVLLGLGEAKKAGLAVLRKPAVVGPENGEDAG